MKAARTERFLQQHDQNKQVIKILRVNRGEFPDFSRHTKSGLSFYKFLELMPGRDRHRRDRGEMIFKIQSRVAAAINTLQK